MTRHTVPIFLNMTLYRATLLSAALALLSPAAAWAGRFDDDSGGEDQPIRFSGLMDLRYARTSQHRSWLLGGPNKLRYGGADIDNNGSGDRASHIFAVPQLSLVVDADVPMDAEVHLQLNLDADSDSGNGSAGLIEAFGRRSWSFEKDQLFLKAGAFFPPISWEHPEPAWSTRYTVTPSAIGSWVGEEVRTFGLEGVWRRQLGEHAAQLTGAAFTGGDQTGWIILEWGWSLHDYQADLNATLPLPNNRQERPFKELDGRMGGYGRLDFSLFNELVKVGGGYWDNNGDIGAFNAQLGNSESVWSTQFHDIGAKVSWRGMTLISQVLRGRTGSVAFTRRNFDSWYTLASARMADFTLSGRYDEYWCQGWEKGWAMTGALSYHISVKQRLTAEYVHSRAAPSLAVRPGSRKDEIFQLNYRLGWGG